MGEYFRHVFWANVGNALESEAHVNGVPGAQVVLDALVDQVDQITVLTDQNRDEQIALEETIFNSSFLDC